MEFGFVIEMILVVAILAMVYRLSRPETKISKKRQEIEAALEEIQKRVLVVTSADITGQTVQQVLGQVRGVSETPARSRAEFDLAEREALLSMISAAIRLGGNAIVDARLSMGTYEQRGSKWQVSQAVYTGTAVLIEPATHRPGF